MGRIRGVRARRGAGRVADVGAQPAQRAVCRPETYFVSVTAHGTWMAYVLTTFFVMGFGYFVAETALGRDLPGVRAAWGAYALGVIGTIMAVVTVMTGRASVLYTFYPPLTASAFYYIGLVLVVVGSWVWCVIMIVAMARWKRANPGRPVPLAMFATVANAIMWLWTTLGVAAELLFQVIPAALGWTETIDVGLSRTLFSWTLHAIVYFWLFPAYIAFYTMAPAAAGGRLYSDTMGRLSFVLFLLYSLPVGLHHLFMDPEHSTGFKFMQMFLTVSRHDADLADRIHDHRLVRDRRAAARRHRAFRLDRALPWDRPMVLATGLAFFMLWFGGGGGLINMSYGMNAMVHNTSWVTAHFHLIFGGTVVIMYFAIAYEIWPALTGRRPDAAALASQRRQLWLWAIGMLVMTLPWHWLGLNGQWRRVAHFDYADPVIAWWGPWVVVSLIGGMLLVVSAFLFVWNLAQLHEKPTQVGAAAAPVAYAAAAAPDRAGPGRAQRLCPVECAGPRADDRGLWVADRAVRGVSVAGRRDPPGRRRGIRGHERQRRYQRQGVAALGRRCGRRVAGCRGRSRRCRDPDRAGERRRHRSVHGDLPRASGLRPVRRRVRRRLRNRPPIRSPASHGPTQPWANCTGPSARTARRSPRSGASACHTVEGNTPDPTIPRNAGQSRFAIYKQLHDYKSGARVSDIMTPLVADLSDKQIADLAAFYGKLVRGAIDPERAFPPYVGIEDRESGNERRRCARAAALYFVSRHRCRRPDRNADDHRSICAISASPACSPSQMASVTTTSIIACAASPRG